MKKLFNLKKITQKLITLIAFLIIALTVIYIYLYPYYEVPILAYHALAPIDKWPTPVVSLESFKKQMDYIKEHGYKVISLDEYCHIIKEGRKPERRSVVITFDDGYKNIFQGLQYLRDLDFPVTIFLPYWYIDKSLPYPYEENPDSKAINKTNYLDYQDISGLLKTSRLSIGSHTITHLVLVHKAPGIIKNEISLSKELFESMFGIEVSTIAYPVGAFDREIQRYVKEAGYDCAVTTNRGYSKDSDVYAIRRVKMTEKDVNDIRLFGKLSGYYNFFRKVEEPNGG
ncbi:MAG: polysaccharide deacetylase family protein [Candidatus Omnitrophica bacterium]|nr:polysaccharide deacetylase family protein [Candidatus Omnitrophota bacterium]MDD5081485.1 polysaccharide deacetylase family protein [Candidatus Omnitrophota bacterium]MDD5440793.1 polysaccharide deacetylase family protein [Candidatus Omnitrophota bacterium]